MHPFSPHIQSHTLAEANLVILEPIFHTYILLDFGKRKVEKEIKEGKFGKREEMGKEVFRVSESMENQIPSRESADEEEKK